MICRFCGKEIPNSVKFCKYCGARTEPVRKLCPSCGKPGIDNENFCRYCGTGLVQPVSVPVSAPVKSVAVSDRPPVQSPAAAFTAESGNKPGSAPVSPKKKPKTGAKKKGRKLIALLLAAVTVFCCVRHPWKKTVKPESGLSSPESIQYELAMNGTPEFTGCSDIFFDEQDVISTETIEIGPDSADCATDSGVYVSFDPYTVSDSGHSLTVSTFREKSDGAYQGVAYDFLLDGSSARLSGVAQISVPYDPAWGDNVFVQYYNEESGNWEILYTETDGNGSATFYTDHFCTFAVFRDMVTSLSQTSPAEAGQIFRLYGDDPLNMKIMVDYPALAAYLRQQSPSTIKETSGQTAPYFVEKGLETMGFYTSSADLAAKSTKTAALLAGGFEKVAGLAKSSSEMLGHFGAVLTVSKLMTNVYRRGENIDFYETLKDNQTDLAALSLYAGSALCAGSVAAFCNAAGILLFVYTTADAAITSINLKGSGSTEEYAYRNFSTKYLVYNKKTGVCYPRYVANEKEDSETYYRDSVNDIPLPSSAACQYADWYAFFDSIKKLRPDIIPAKIDNVLTQYASVFWNLPQTDQNTLNRYLKNTRTGFFGWSSLADDYKRPSKFKINEYKSAFKADLYKWLRPYMQECLRASYFAMLNDAFREAAELERQFNAEISFVLQDRGTETFDRSPYALYQCALSGTQGGEIGYDGTVNQSAGCWNFTKDNGYRLSCTYLSYLLYGTPAYLRIRDGSRDVLSLEIAPVYPQTVIEIGEPAQTGSDYVWTLTDVWYGDRSQEGQYPLRMYAIYNNGDNILTPFEYGYEIIFDEAQYGFTANLNSNSFSTSSVSVASPGRLVRSAQDFVFTSSVSSFEVRSPQEAWEASPPYFEVAVKTSRFGSMYYLTDGDSAQIPQGTLTAGTVKDQAYESGTAFPGDFVIPDPGEDSAGQKVLFDAYGVCYLYQVLPSGEAEKTQPSIHHGDIWAFSHADEALD